MLKYYIDNTLVSPPLEREQDGQRIFFDNTLKGRLISNSEDSLTFYREGFNVLRALYCEGLCQTIPFRITETCEGAELDRFLGFIRLSETSLDLSDCFAEVTVVSDSYHYKIEANKNSKIRPSYNKSQNDVDIVTAESYNVFRSFQQSNFRTVYLLKDIFNHALQFISDGELTLQPGGLLDDPVCEWITLTNGAKLSLNASSEPIEYTFSDILDCILKLKGAAWTIKNGEFILVSYCDMFKCDESLEFKDLKVLKIEADQDNLFSSIDIGGVFRKTEDGKDTKCDGSTAATDLHFKGPKSGLYSWGETNINIPYECTTDKTLDITCRAIVDHNSVEDAFENCAGDNAASIFLIDTVPFDLPNRLLQMKETSISGSAEVYINEFFLNINVLKRNECYLRSLGIPFDSLFPIATATIGQNALIGETNTADTYFPIKVDLVGGVGVSLVGLPAGFDASDQAVQFIPPASGNYQFIYDALFGNLTFVGTKLVETRAVILDAGTFTEIAAEDFYSGTISSQTKTEGYTVVETELVAGTPYLISVVGQSGYGASAGVTTQLGSIISVYPSKGNELIDTTAIRSSIIEIEGLVCREDWDLWKENNSQCISGDACGFHVKGWIHDVKHNNYTNKITGTLKGGYTCLEAERLCREITATKFQIQHDFTQASQDVDTSKDIYFDRIRVVDGGGNNFVSIPSPMRIVQGGVVQDLNAISADYLTKINTILASYSVPPIYSFEILSVTIGTDAVTVDTAIKGEFATTFQNPIPRFDDVYMRYTNNSNQGGSVGTTTSGLSTEIDEICD